MKNLNIFDMMGIEEPKSKVEVKKEKTEKKETKLAVKTKAESKLTVKLPVKCVIQGTKTLDVTSEMLSISEANVSDKTVKEYLAKEYPYTKIMDFSFEKDTCYIGFYPNGKIGSMEVKGDSSILFGDFSLDLAELSNGEAETSKIESKDLATYISSMGLPLGEDAASVKFITKTVNKKDYVIPMPKETTDSEIEKGLVLPIVVHLYGDYDDITISNEKAMKLCSEKDIKKLKITKKMLIDAVIKQYPELDKHLQICAIDKEMNTVCAMMVPITAVTTTSKKKELLIVDDNTIFRFYATTITPDKEQLPNGEYTLKELCKILAKQGIPEFNNADSITYKKMKNTYCFAVKFGGSKGAQAVADLAKVIETPYSSYTTTVNDDYICIQPSYCLVESEEKYSFTLRLPKIPCDIYNKIVSLFQKIAQISNKECLARIYWDMDSEKYELIIPFQKASVARVEAIDDGFPNDDFVFTHIPVLEVHSHGLAYKAFFSPIDDASELSKYALYGVFSFVDGINADVHQLFRCCCGKEHAYNITKDELFEKGDYYYDGEFVKTMLSYQRLR